MDEVLPIGEIKKRVIKALLSLSLRQILLNAITFISINFVLAKILPVATLGVFEIGGAIIAFFAYFADVGLAAALIQKKEQVTKEDIKTTFTIQFLIVGILSLLIIIAAPFLAHYYTLDHSGVWFIRILGIGFFLTGFKVLPSVMMERKLRFQPQVTVELIETLVFNALLIYLSLQNYGLWAFSIASLVRALIGVILIYIMAPIKIGIGIDMASAKKLLSFGVPFQLYNLLALLKDRLVPVVVAHIIGANGFGLVTWAQGMANMPLQLITTVNMVTFPAFSRLQHDRQSLTKAVEKCLYVTTVVIYPCIAGLCATMPFIILYIVSPKWTPALPSFYLFSIAAFWSVLSTTLTNVLNATGLIKNTLKLMVMWTVLEWVLSPPLSIEFGFIGVSIAASIIAFTSVFTIIMVKRALPISVVSSITFPTLASIFMGITVFSIAHFFVTDIISLIIVILLGILIYGLAIFLFQKDKVIKEIKNIRHV